MVSPVAKISEELSPLGDMGLLRLPSPQDSQTVALVPLSVSSSLPLRYVSAFFPSITERHVKANPERLRRGLRKAEGE